MRTLPERPSLEHLKNQARRRLRELRAADPAARLADAQLQIAREHGFDGWRRLKAFVEQARAPTPHYANLAGFYRHDPHDISNAVVAILVEDGRLVWESVRDARFDLSEETPGRFVISGVPGHHVFEGGGEGPASAIVSHGRLGSARLERVGESQARAIRAARAQAQAEETRPRTPIVLPAALLQRYVGRYAPKAGPSLEILRQDDRLKARVDGQPAMEIVPESETRFFFYIVPTTQMAFVLERGEVVAVVLQQGGIGHRYERLAPGAADVSDERIRERLAEQQRPRTLVEIDPAIPHRYAGRYHLDGARVVQVTAEQGRLFVEITGQPRWEVYPESEDTFFWTVVAAQITFVAGRDGRMSHAVLHQNGRDIGLPRLADEEAAA